MYYVPLSAITGGAAEIRNKSSSSSGFWTAQLHSGDKSAELTVFDEGALKDLAKVSGPSLGKERDPPRRLLTDVHC